MNGSATSEAVNGDAVEIGSIISDEIRWGRRKWLAAIVLILAAQAGVLFLISDPPAARAAAPPPETKLVFGPGQSAPDWPGWLLLENPMLFAEPSWQGFSGQAWMAKPAWRPPNFDELPPAQFLRWDEARSVAGRSAQPLPVFAALPSRRPAPKPFSLSNLPAPPLSSARTLVQAEGFHGRALAAPLPVPLQPQPDALGRCVVEAIVDETGVVLSARVIESSSSAPADRDAVRLARTARFERDSGFAARLAEGPPGLALGKLIFQWGALDLAQTNNVQR